LKEREEGREDGGAKTYQCGQRSIASGVMRGEIEVAVMLGVVRRIRTGETVGLGWEVEAEVALGADVGG